VASRTLPLVPKAMPPPAVPWMSLLVESQPLSRQEWPQTPVRPLTSTAGSAPSACMPELPILVPRRLPQ
jgi:hypothetical protein